MEIIIIIFVEFGINISQKLSLAHDAYFFFFFFSFNVSTISILASCILIKSLFVDLQL